MMASFEAAAAALGLGVDGSDDEMMTKASQVWQFLDSLATSDPKGKTQNEREERERSVVSFRTDSNPFSIQRVLEETSRRKGRV